MPGFNRKGPDSTIPFTGRGKGRRHPWAGCRSGNTVGETDDNAASGLGRGYGGMRRRRAGMGADTPLCSADTPNEIEVLTQEKEALEQQLAMVKERLTALAANTEA